jgi:hypothetical protein
MYPDNPKDRYYSGKYMATIDDKLFELEIVEGVIKTDRKDIGAYLLS